MKCNNCDFENRKGVKFCEECGQQLKMDLNPICSLCGFKNRSGVRFCEECGAALTAAPAASAPPRRRTKPAPQTRNAQAAPAIVVQAQVEKKKRRLNPLWLLLLLLLILISCCCLLLLFEQVEVPDFATPYLDPIIDGVRDFIPIIDVINGDRNQENGIGEGNGNKKPAPTCEQFRVDLKKVRLGQDTWCTDNECWTDLHNIEFYQGLKVRYRWGTNLKKESVCEEMNDFIRCFFPRDLKEDKVTYWISIDDCVEDLGYSDGWLSDSAEEPPEPELSESSACCPNYDFYNIYYDNGYLYFDVVCRAEDFRDQCAEGKVYDGAGNFWTDVFCCTDPNLLDSALRCEGLDFVTAKVGNVRLDLEYTGNDGGTCQIYSPFSPPTYSPPSIEADESGSSCPPGESLCAGSCCSNGHCCDWGSGLGCYESCP